jgi:hypothetical protein
MKKRNLLIGGGSLLAIVFLVFAAAPFAFAKDDISRQLINDPNTSWTVYGPQTNKQVRDKNVQGGGAIEVTVDAVAGNPWDAAAQVPITRKISKGDRILAAAWLKAVTTSGAPADLNMRLQINTAPYDALVEKRQSVKDGWKLYSIETVATRDYAEGTCVLVVHLASAQQVVDLGPAFVLNMDSAR